MAQAFLKLILSDKGLGGISLTDEAGVRLPAVNGHKAMQTFRNGEQANELEALTKLQAYAVEAGITEIG